MRIFCSVCLLISTINISAQKGLPPAETTIATVHTAYPKQLDFKDSLALRLHVPDGYKLSVAASGLGKPRNEMGRRARCFSGNGGLVE